MSLTHGIFRATYRLQLHHQFQFKDIQRLLNYFNDLGVSHLYLSPIFEARPKSNHGYDGINPQQVSIERGGEAQLQELLNSLHSCQKKDSNLRGLILDIVPNHLATCIQNPLWREALKNGPQSEFWNFFDIRGNKVILPVLAESLTEVLNKGELEIDFNETDGFIFKYYEQAFPLSTESSITLQQLAERKSLPLKDKDILKSLLEKQFYILEPWRTGVQKINYRRFFDINDLIGLRVEDASVFEWTHQKVFDLLKNPAIHGLRIDHIDGLLSPKQYLLRLRHHTDNIWVEKILSEDEVLPYDWPVLGSTGYDFSSMVTRIFVDESGYQKIHDFYLASIDRTWNFFSDCVYESKREALRTLFEKEFSTLGQEIHAYCQETENNFSLSPLEIQTVLEEISVCLKVYRLFYQTDKFVPGVGQNDLRWLSEAVEEVKRRHHMAPVLLDWAFHFLSENPTSSERKSKILGHWQQITGPLMAKGFEDTALYRYVPLVSVNTIGGQPDWNYSTVMEFHAFIQERLKSHPLSLNATTTHDTKRNEDVRSRIHVLSELPELWMQKFTLWKEMNESPKNTSFLSKVSEYFIYQTLLGVWPLDRNIDSDFVTRMKDYFIKAAREAKRETRWLAINQDYESQLTQFLNNILNQKKNSQFINSFSEFAEITGYFGAFNSLGELTIRLLSPGVPDTYQGTEIWSYSLVDPDNRRPVNYALLQAYSQRAQEKERRAEAPASANTVENWKNGEIKFVILRQLLRLRNQYPLLFENGHYIPLEFKGHRQSHAFGFARSLEEKWIICVIPRFLAATAKIENSLSIPADYWDDTTVHLPLMSPRKWKNLLTKQSLTLKTEELQISLAYFFANMPVCIWISE